MPQCCSVPLCSIRSAGHKFPKDEKLLKKWLIAIRRDHFSPTKQSRVCKNHFTPDNYYIPQDSVRDTPKPYLKKNAVPSIFNWTAEPSDNTKKRAKRARSRRTLSLPEKRYDIPGPSVEVADNTDESILLPDTWEPVTVEFRTLSNTCPLRVPSATEVPVCENDGTKSVTVNDVSKKTKLKFRLESLVDNPTMMHYYTGFDNHDHFMFVFNLFGEEVYNLKYYPNILPATLARILNPADEFLMTLIKLRQNIRNSAIAFLFGVSKSSVSTVFITWINYLHYRFKDLNVWARKSVIEENMKFRGKKCSCTVIIDCTEIKIEKPLNPVSQQLTYSSYKSCNTLKVLVGISPSGTVTFVSDAYGSSVSDRELFEKSGIIDLLSNGDIILCDRGFNIQDLVAHKNVTVNMPEFLQKNFAQFSPGQLRKSKMISSERIHVERIIALAKTYKMLSSKLRASLVTLGSRIIFVCFMLANFRFNIVL